MKSIFITRIGVALALCVSVAGATGCSGTGASRLQETPPPTEAARLLADAYHASAVADAMDRIVARDRRFDVDPENGFNRSGTSGMLLPGSDDASGSGEVIISQSSAEAGFVTSSVPWRDDGQLEFYVEITPYDQEEGGVLATRYIDTSYRRGAFEGFTTSGAAVSDHGLGAGWQALQATNVYEGGGTLTVRLYTDVDDADILDRPWANTVFERQEARHDIVLDDVPPLPAGRDWRSISIPARGLAGSLDGTEGRFSCLDAGCSLDNERLLPDWEGYHPGYDGSNVVIFTPADGGPSVLLAGSDSRRVPEGNYLTFGNWVYAPEDASDVDAFEVGVFEAGRDPFTTSQADGACRRRLLQRQSGRIVCNRSPPCGRIIHGGCDPDGRFRRQQRFWRRKRPGLRIRAGERRPVATEPSASAADFDRGYRRCGTGDGACNPSAGRLGRGRDRRVRGMARRMGRAIFR